MSTVTVNTLKSRLDDYLISAVEFSEPLVVTTQKGNAVILSEDDYRAMLETCFLLQCPGMLDRVREAQEIPIAESDDFEW